MIRLQVDPQVVAALKVEVPKTNKAAERIEKYVSTLENEINIWLATPRTAQMLKHELYLVRLTVMHDDAGKIESLGQIRTHKWLEDHNLALIEHVNSDQSNNYTGEIAKVRFTKLATVIDDDDLNTLKNMTAAERLAHLQTVPATSVSQYMQRLNDFNNASKPIREQEYDLLEVNQKSTIQYICDLITSHVFNKDRAEYKKAIDVLRIAQLNNGIYPQKKKVSPFGRTYYENVSIQSVKKSLRRAILKDCYEYDVKSCVITWKYAFADMLLQSNNSQNLAKDDFYAIYYYLTYKPHFFQSLLSQVFTQTTNWSKEKQEKNVKSAITALSFGARLSKGTWRNKFGDDENSCLVDIFNNHHQELVNFINAPEVTAFTKQQAQLDKFIVNRVLENDPSLTSLDILQTESGRTSTPKVLAYLYQKAETIIMNIVRAELKKLNIAVKANIHDAIVLEHKLTKAQKAQIETLIKRITGMKLFALGETHYQ